MSEIIARYIKARTKILIGIDPDVDKSGVAVYDRTTRKIEQMMNLDFFKLLDYLKDTILLYEDTETRFKVFIEAGYLNKTNWHTKGSDSVSKAAQIGLRTGANHEVARKIIEMCDYLGVEHEEVRPRTSKMNHDLFVKCTGCKCKRTNQEQRDAAMLVFGM